MNFSTEDGLFTFATFSCSAVIELQWNINALHATSLVGNNVLTFLTLF